MEIKGIFLLCFLVLFFATIQVKADVDETDILEGKASKVEEGGASKLEDDNSGVKKTMKRKGVRFRMAAKPAQGSSSSTPEDRKFKTASARRSRSRSSSSRSRSSSSSSRRSTYTSRSRSCNNSTGSCTSRRGKGDPIVGAAFLALMSPCICCICYKNWRAKTYTHCRFCEVEVKWKEYKEHRENCFTENLDKIKGFKEAPLPKECPKDENHILYQWPDRKKNGSKFECEEPNCDNPARIEVTKKSSKGTGKNKKTTSKKVKTKDVKWSEGQHLHCLLCNYSRCMDCHQKIKLALAADLLLAQQAEAEKAKAAAPPPAPAPEAPAVIVNVVAPPPQEVAAPPPPPPPPAFKPFSMTCKEEGCGFVTDSAEDEAHLPLVMKAYELHVSTAHGPPPHLEYVAPPTEDELYGGGPRPDPEAVAAAAEAPPPEEPTPAPPAVEAPPPPPAPANAPPPPEPPAAEPEAPAACPEPNLPGQPD